MAKLQTFSYFTSQITIDDAVIDLEIKRMTNAEFDAFFTAFAATGDEQPGAAPESVEESKQREAAHRSWIKETFDQYVKVLPDQIVHDGRDVAPLGAGILLDIYGGRRDVVPELLALICGENRISESQKKSYRSQLASQIGLLPERQLTARGDAPAPTAASVEPSSSAPVADAMDGLGSASSGTTDQ